MTLLFERCEGVVLEQTHSFTNAIVPSLNLCAAPRSPTNSAVYSEVSVSTDSVSRLYFPIAKCYFNEHGAHHRPKEITGCSQLKARLDFQRQLTQIARYATNFSASWLASGHQVAANVSSFAAFIF